MQICIKTALKYFCLFSAFSIGLVLTGCSGSDSNLTDSTDSTDSTTAQLGIYGSTVVENADDLEFVVSLSVQNNETVSVNYATANGTAVAGTDYAETSGTLQFLPGEQRKFVSVSVINNTDAPAGTAKSMRLVLSEPQNAELNTSASSATGTIIDRHAMTSNAAFNKNWGATGAFTNAATCGANCHVSSDPTMSFNGKDISPYAQWQHSVMANSFNDPYWQAAVEDEVDSFPALAGFIEDTCTTCHAPMGRTHAHETGSMLDGDNYYRFETAKNEHHAREGVSCTLCHQVDSDYLGGSDSFSGNFKIPGTASPKYKNIYGPYENPVGTNMENQTGHKPSDGSSYVSRSEICASCHTLYTPALDPDTGSPSGSNFLEQGPYLEWQNSVYASGQPQEKHCQDCHMPEPAPGYATKISLMPGTAPERTRYPQHTLVGGNSHLLEILRDYRSELGIEASTSAAGFDEQISLTKSFLNTAASLNISTPVTADNILAFDIDVSNHTGHKMPSAYPSRRMWLHVTVKNAAEQIIFESGKVDYRGYISTDEARLKADCMSAHKLDGFDSMLCYEIHRDVITDASQVAIYETVLGDVNTNITHTLLQGAQYLKDNRIPPQGFTNSKAATIEAQTIPAGVDGDNDFNCVNTAEGCGADSVHYRVNIEGHAGPYRVETELLYQATQPGFVDGMHNTGDRVNRFKVMYDDIPPTVEVLASETAVSQ